MPALHWLCAAAALAALLLAGCPSGPPVEGTGVGDIALDFSLKDANEQDHTLWGYRGNVVWVQFMNVVGISCQTEARESMVYYERYRDQGLVVLAILIGGEPDSVIDAVDCAAWASEYGLAYPVLYDGSPDDTWGTFHGPLEVPTNMIVDRSGIIRYKRPGWSQGGGTIPNLIFYLLSEP